MLGKDREFGKDVSRNCSVPGRIALRCCLGIQMATLCALPWLLGGAIPHARLLLALGTAGASLFCGFYLLLERIKPVLPLTSLPFLGLALIGLIQLLPWFDPVVLGMNHAVLPREFGSSLSTLSEFGRESAKVPRTVYPAETRQVAGQMLAVFLFFLTLYQTVSDGPQLIGIIGSMIISGCAMTILALSQQFGASSVLVGNHWKVSNSTPFGCFVNPNNAAGWLITCLAASLTLCGILLSQTTVRGVRLPKAWATWSDRLWISWVEVTSRVSALDAPQILSLLAVVILGVGIAATLSRAGIVAGALGLLAFLLSRFRFSHWLPVTLGAVTVLFMAFGLLTLLDLDTVVLSELSTLKDPVSDTTGRVLHWSDSLHHVFDFPVLGSGLGGYRYASLPYQQHYTGKWFQRADNQFVEVLIEGGILGLCCMVATWLLAALFVRRIIVRRSDGSRRISTGRWIASGVVCLLAALPGAAFFDYGISLPPVILSAGAMVVLLERRVADLRGQSENHGVWSSRIRSGTTLALWGAGLAVMLSLIPDHVAAAAVYEAIVPAERQLSAPTLKQLTLTGDTVLADLNAALARRTDDLQGLRTRVLFLKLIWRKQVLQTAATDQNQSDGQLQNLFAAMTIPRITGQTLHLPPGSQVRVQYLQQLQELLAANGWNKYSESLLEQCLLTPGIAADLVLLQIAGLVPGGHQQTLEVQRFSEPHSAINLYTTGLALHQAGDSSEARDCWQQCLTASESLLPDILLASRRAFGLERTLQDYLPRSFEGCARVVPSLGADPELRKTVSDMADQIWDRSPPRFTESTALLRARQLQAMSRYEAAVQWTTESLELKPYSMPLRKLKAALLEAVGRNEEAYNEWLTIRSLSGVQDRECEVALKRLIRLPPKPVKLEG